MTRWFKRTGSEVLGWGLVVVGLGLLVLPGPGLLALVAGIALLAPHYEWAQRLFHPLHERAVAGAKQGVATKTRILLSAAGMLWVVLLGVVWLVSPQIPEYSLSGLQVGPTLPGGRTVGLGLLASGLAGLALLAYSVKRWYPGSPSFER